MIDFAFTCHYDKDTNKPVIKRVPVSEIKRDHDVTILVSCLANATDDFYPNWRDDLTLESVQGWPDDETNHAPDPTADLPDDTPLPPAWYCEPMCAIGPFASYSDGLRYGLICRLHNCQENDEETDRILEGWILTALTTE